MAEIRVGQGFDVHPLVTGRRLVLGGVEIPFEKGLLGHSDADVLLHAISDALLGAAGLGDIGSHFPPSDPKSKDADSLKLLCEVARLIKAAGFHQIVNIDATVLAERPPINPHITEMKKRISDAMGIAPSRIGIKATTSERLGFVGREEGIAAMAVCLICAND